MEVHYTIDASNKLAITMLYESNMPVSLGWSGGLLGGMSVSEFGKMGVDSDSGSGRGSVRIESGGEDNMSSSIWMRCSLDSGIGRVGMFVLLCGGGLVAGSRMSMSMSMLMSLYGVVGWGWR